MTGLFLLVTILSQVSLLIPIVIWILSIRNASITLRLIFLSVLLLSLEEILMSVLSFLNGNNLVVANYSTLPILFIFYLAYYLNEDFTPPIRRAIGITGVAGLLFISYFLINYPTDQFLNTVHAIAAGCMVLLAIYYFIHKVFYTTQFEISKHALFYISSAIFVYNFTVMGIMSSYNLIEHDLMIMLWTIKLIAYIFYNCAIAYGFHIFKRYRLAI